MNRFFPGILMVLAFWACNHPVPKSVSASNIIITQTIKFDSEKIVINEAPNDVEITTAPGDSILVKHRLAGEQNYRQIGFRYIRLSDVAFTDTAIYDIHQPHFIHPQCPIFKNSVLMIPVQINDHRFSIYMVNLKMNRLIVADVRTEFRFVWTNQDQDEFLIADTRDRVNDSLSQYKIYSYKVADSGVILLKRAPTAISNNADERTYFNIAEKILK